MLETRMEEEEIVKGAQLIAAVLRGLAWLAVAALLAVGLRWWRGGA